MPAPPILSYIYTHIVIYAHLIILIYKFNDINDINPLYFYYNHNKTQNSSYKL